MIYHPFSLNCAVSLTSSCVCGKLRNLRNPEENEILANISVTNLIFPTDSQGRELS